MLIDSNIDAVKGQIWANGSIPQRSVSHFFALWGRQSLRPVGLFFTMLSMQPPPTPPHSDIALGVASLDTWRPIVEMWLVAVIVGPKVPMRHESAPLWQRFNDLPEQLRLSHSHIAGWRELRTLHFIRHESSPPCFRKKGPNPSMQSPTEPPQPPNSGRICPAT